MFMLYLLILIVSIELLILIGLTNRLFTSLSAVLPVLETHFLLIRLLDFCSRVIKTILNACRIGIPDKSGEVTPNGFGLFA